MISRVADHCFWFGRYLERAESTARVLHVTSSLALDAELPQEQCWIPVVIVAGEREHFTRRHGEAAAGDGEIVQRYMTWDEDNLTCVLRSVSAARDNARSIREVVSLEAWETVNELYLWITSDAARADFELNRYAFYRRVRSSVQLCLGLLRSTMLHDEPLDFIWLGVMLERAGQTARILDVHHHAFTQLRSHQVVETALWLSLLRACSGFEPFMKRHQGKVTGDAVAAFLLLEPAFPRSIRYCVHTAFQRLQEIRPAGAKSLPGGLTLARLGALDDWICQKSPGDLGGAIHDLLTRVVDETAAVCDGLARELFAIGPSFEPPDEPLLPSSSPSPSFTQSQSQGQSQSQHMFSLDATTATQSA